MFSFKVFDKNGKCIGVVMDCPSWSIAEKRAMDEYPDYDYLERLI